MVLEKALESPLDCKEIQLVHSKGDQSWDFFGRNDAKAETPVLWASHMKIWLIGKDSDAERDCGETVETVSDFIFLGSKITVDGDCSHEIKKRLLLEGKLWPTYTAY